ncbi:MAG: GNAT family N-acetyltransferase [Actinomadura sp.]
MTILTTRRLTLVPWRHTHIDELRRLAGDERVVRFVGDRRPWSAALTAARHAVALEHWIRYGFGWRAALDTATADFVGLGALTYRGPEESGIGTAAIELGWWVAPAFWGRGLATEIGRAVLDEAFLDHGAESVITRHQDGNAASARIIAGLGLVRHHSTPGSPRAPYLTHVHALDRAAFLASRPACGHRHG